MYEDAKQELKRLEEALLAEEEQPAPAQTDFRAYNTDKTDEDMEDFSQRVLDGEKKGMTVLTVLAAALAGAVVAALLFFLIRYRGLFL